MYAFTAVPEHLTESRPVGEVQRRADHHVGHRQVVAHEEAPAVERALDPCGGVTKRSRALAARSGSDLAVDRSLDHGWLDLARSEHGPLVDERPLVAARGGPIIAPSGCRSASCMQIAADSNT